MAQLPEGWIMAPLDHLADVHVSSVDKKTYPNESFVRVCNYTDVYYNDSITADLPFLQASASTEQVSRSSIRGGDAVITKDSESSDDIGRPAYVPHDIPGAVYGYHLAVYRPRRTEYGKYLRYVFDSAEVRREFQVRTPGVTRVGLSQNTLRHVRVPLPTPDEASAIADYLDHETAEIDAFITDQERLRNLVLERLHSERDRLVSDAGAPIPLRRGLRFLTSGSRGWGDLVGDIGEPFVRITNLTRSDTRPNLEDLKRVSGVESAEGSRSRIALGDLLVSITADLGSVAVAGAELAGGYTSQHVALVRLNRDTFNPEFVAQALLTSAARKQLREKSYGGTKIQLALSDIKELEVPIPKMPRQQAIAEAMRSRTDAVAQTLEDVRLHIALARERRAALISAAVTGQIDVTQKQKPVAEQLEDEVKQLP